MPKARLEKTRIIRLLKHKDLSPTKLIHIPEVLVINILFEFGTTPSANETIGYRISTLSTNLLIGLKGLPTRLALIAGKGLVQV